MDWIFPFLDFEMGQTKEEIGMRKKVKRFLIVIAGIWLLLLIACSAALYIFFPDILHPEAEAVPEPTTGMSELDPHGCKENARQ